MNDQTTPTKQTKDAVAEFVKKRNRQQFNSPKNLSMDISVEAAELTEYFLLG